MRQRHIWYLSSTIIHYSFYSFVLCIRAKKDVITDKTDEMKISRQKRKISANK